MQIQCVLIHQCEQALFGAQCQPKILLYNGKYYVLQAMCFTNSDHAYQFTPPYWQLLGVIFL